MTNQGQKAGNRLEEFNIVVNGKAKQVSQQVLSYAEVVNLAFPTPPAEGDIVYLVSYNNADQDPKKGDLVAGQSVKIRNGTSFDVRHTVRS